MTKYLDLQMRGVVDATSVFSKAFKMSHSAFLCEDGCDLVDEKMVWIFIWGAVVHQLDSAWRPVSKEAFQGSFLLCSIS